MVSFLGFVVIPIFEKDFDALLDGVFFHGYEINYMLVVKNFLELINKEGFLGEHYETIFRVVTRGCWNSYQ
jgi:hypothetical protein